jgi:hypothetical protein
MKIGQRVQTPHGPGTIKAIETVSDKHPRAGVKHDEYPEKMPRFRDNLLYYFLTDLKKI